MPPAYPPPSGKVYSIHLSERLYDLFASRLHLDSETACTNTEEIRHVELPGCRDDIPDGTEFRKASWKISAGLRPWKARKKAIRSRNRERPYRSRIILGASNRPLAADGPCVDYRNIRAHGWHGLLGICCSSMDLNGAWEREWNGRQGKERKGKARVERRVSKGGRVI